MTHGHNGPCLRMHVANSIGHADTVLPTSRTAPLEVSASHTIRWDGMERHDQLTAPAYGASDEQGRDVEPSLSSSTGTAGPA